MTLKYLIPQNNGQRLAAQADALEAVQLESPTSDNELTMLGGITESSPRVVTVVGGAEPSLRLTVTYSSTAEFLLRFPTEATQIQALSNLWTQRIGSLLRTPCTASIPVIT